MIYLVGYTPSPPKVQIDKVSLGAEKWVPFEQVKDLKRKIKKLKKRGVQIIALEKSKESMDIAKAKFNKQVALIVGNEVDGVEDDILEMCDQVVHISMFGRKESLNVSVATGIALYEIKQKIE